MASPGRGLLQPMTHRRSPHAARARVGRRHAVRRIKGPGRCLLGVRGHVVREPPRGPDAPGRRRRGQRPRQIARWPVRARRLGAVRCVHADITLRSGRRVVPPRRERPAGRGERDPGAGRAGLHPRHRRPPGHDEPARRSRDGDTGRLVVARPVRAGLGLPGVLWAGREHVRRRSAAHRHARCPRRGQRRRDRQGLRITARFVGDRRRVGQGRRPARGVDRPGRHVPRHGRPVPDRPDQPGARRHRARWHAPRRRLGHRHGLPGGARLSPDPTDERLGQPLVVGGLVVALGGDADEDAPRRRVSLGGRGRPGPDRDLDPVLELELRTRAPRPRLGRGRRPMAGRHRAEHRVRSRRAIPSAAARMSRPSSASARLAAMSDGQPPPSGAATVAIQSIAAGRAR